MPRPDFDMFALDPEKLNVEPVGKMPDALRSKREYRLIENEIGETLYHNRCIRDAVLQMQEQWDTKNNNNKETKQ